MLSQCVLSASIAGIHNCINSCSNRQNTALHIDAPVNVAQMTTFCKAVFSFSAHGSAYGRPESLHAPGINTVSIFLTVYCHSIVGLCTL